MRIKKEYQQFLRKKVDEKWLSKYNSLTVLGENFIDGYYILIFEVNDTQAIIEELNKKCEDLF